LQTPPVEIVVKLYGWGSGESEVELSIPDTSVFGHHLASVPEDEHALLFARLRHHLVAELKDAFSGLESPLAPARR